MRSAKFTAANLKRKKKRKVGDILLSSKGVLDGLQRLQHLIDQNNAKILPKNYIHI